MQTPGVLETFQIYSLCPPKPLLIWHLCLVSSLLWIPKSQSHLQKYYRAKSSRYPSVIPEVLQATNQSENIQVPWEGRDYTLLCCISISADISCSETKCFLGKGSVVNIQMFNLPKNNQVHTWNSHNSRAPFRQKHSHQN